MTVSDNEIINIGDICAYSFDKAYKCLSIVEIVNIPSNEVVVVKFHQVIYDDSGNRYFTYLSNTGKTMNVLKKYLTKIDLINHLKSANEKSERIIELADKTIKAQSAEIERKTKHIAEIVDECVRFKEAAKRQETARVRNIERVADEEIKKLNAELEHYKKNEKFIDAKCDSILEKVKTLNSEINKSIASAKSEAIKEFAERVYRFLCKEKNWRILKVSWLINGECEWLKSNINSLVKEMDADDNHLTEEGGANNGTE